MIASDPIKSQLNILQGAGRPHMHVGRDRRDAGRQDGNCSAFRLAWRESAQSWRELLVELEARGLAIAPELATGDGALGFWKALEEAIPTTRHQTRGIQVRRVIATPHPIPCLPL
jgi:hypothetical protein